jgi:hypothetical protein
VPLCQDNKYTICAAEDNDASPSRRPFIKFHLCKNAKSQTPTIKALYNTRAAVSLITPADFEAIKRSGVVIGPILEMTCRVQNASQQPMQTEGAWRVRLYLNVAQSIVRINIIGPRRLVMDPVTCTVDFRDKGTAAALGVLGQREGGTITDVRVLKATTIPGRHGQLLKLGLFNAERHRVHASVFGMEQFHHCLITGRFALYMDLRSLCKLSSVHIKTLNRLHLKMTELHPNIKYIECLARRAKNTSPKLAAQLFEIYQDLRRTQELNTTFGGR